MEIDQNTPVNDGSHDKDGLLENDGEGDKRSYKLVLADQSKPDCPPSVSFNCSFHGKVDGARLSTANGSGLGGGEKSGDETGSGGTGKPPPHEFKTLSLSPNEDMILAIRNEQSRLKDIAIFFVCLESDSLPSRKFFDDWIANVWGRKLGIHVTFCRRIQKGILWFSLSPITFKKGF
jgi:hypothetical protein